MGSRNIMDREKTKESIREFPESKRVEIMKNWTHPGREGGRKEFRS